MPSYAAAGTNEADRAQLPGIASVQAVSVLVICLAVALLGPTLIALVTPPPYPRGSVTLIPWIALGYAFLGLYSIPMSALSLGQGRTKFVWVATAGAAVSNVGLIYFLVPMHGIEAAAIASAAGYLVLFVSISLYARNPSNPVGYESGRLLLATSVVVITYAGAVVTTDDTGVMNAIARIGWLAAGVHRTENRFRNA